MLFRKDFLEGIRAGSVTLAFRRWQRPTVRAGGTLLTPAGRLCIQEVARVVPSRISAIEARRAGYASRTELLEELRQRDTGDVYRIVLGPLEPEPSIALRHTQAGSPDELERLQESLRRLDARAKDGAWTFRTLAALDSSPGVCAGELAAQLGEQKQHLKLNARKLKNLGLTQSLEIGYRLSMRGEAWLKVQKRTRKRDVG